MAVINGTDGPDNLVGTNDVDQIVAFGGDDRLEGRGGDDTFFPGLGNDRVEGGDGRDTVRVGGGLPATEVYRLGGAEALIRGPEGVDLLFDVEAVDFGDSGGGTLEVRDAPVFAALSYIASHEDLSRAFGADRDAGLAHFRDFGAREGRAVTFDAVAYVNNNPDLRTAFGFDFEAGAAHFITNGRAEGRTPAGPPTPPPAPVPVNGLQYAASYDDLAAAFAPLGDAAAIAREAAAHFRDRAGPEGRVADRFDGAGYLAANPDVAAVAGFNSDDGAALHYVLHGRAEGRPGGAFDGLQYVASFDDLAAAYAVLGESEAIRAAGDAHFRDFGAREGRATDRFDGATYLARNPDVAAVPQFASDDGAALHYVLFGRAEGRTDDPMTGMA